MSLLRFINIISIQTKRGRSLTWSGYLPRAQEVAGSNPAGLILQQNVVS